MNERLISVGDSVSFSKTLTETDVYNFTGICGDFNPVHVNKEIAAYSKFGQPVCHGMLIASFISPILGMYLPGLGTIYLSQTLRWDAPVYFGDTITDTVTVEKRYEYCDITNNRNKLKEKADNYWYSDSDDIK